MVEDRRTANRTDGRRDLFRLFGRQRAACSILWNSGISFGGVVAFLSADLIVLPILDIYRKYYGMRIAALLFGSFYGAMAGAGYIVELVFGVLGLVPVERRVQILQESMGWNYTTVLDIAALLFSGVLVCGFLLMSGPVMLRMMTAHHVPEHEQRRTD